MRCHLLVYILIDVSGQWVNGSFERLIFWGKGKRRVGKKYAQVKTVLCRVTPVNFKTSTIPGWYLCSTWEASLGGPAHSSKESVEALRGVLLRFVPSPRTLLCSEPAKSCWLPKVNSLYSQPFTSLLWPRRRLVMCQQVQWMSQLTNPEETACSF